MQTSGKTTGSGSGKTVVIAVLVPIGQMAHGGAKGGAKVPPAAKMPQSSQQRVADAMRKALQSSPAAQAAFRRNPTAVAKIGAHAQTLAANPARSPLSALKQGLGVSAGLGSVRRDMLKDFRKGGGEVKTASSHGLSERGQRHADAAERGLRRGGLGLLSAAWHGTKIMREQRKTLNRERADARADAQASGKPAPPEGMRALLGSAVKGVGIARGLRAGLSDMHTQERARHRAQAHPQQGVGGHAHGGTAGLLPAIDDRPHSSAPEGGSDGRGRQSGQSGQGDPGHGAGPQVLRATGFAFGAMAFHSADGSARGSGADARPILAVGFALWMPPRHSAPDEEVRA